MLRKQKRQNPLPVFMRVVGSVKTGSRQWASFIRLGLVRFALFAAATENVLPVR